MTRARLLLPFLLLIAGPATLPRAAAAQCRLCDTPATQPSQGERERGPELRIESSLDFDQVVLLAAGEGSAILRPDGSTSASGAVGDVSARAMVGTAVIEGEPGRAVRVDLPRRISLYGVNGIIHFEEVVSDLPSVPRLDSSGKLSFRFGGRLRLAGDADGSYRGEIPITVEYQ